MSRICPGCGSQIDDDSDFCDVCGAEINSINKKKYGKLIIIAVIAAVTIAAVIIAMLLVFKSQGGGQNSELSPPVTESSNDISSSPEQTESKTESSEISEKSDEPDSSPEPDENDGSEPGEEDSSDESEISEPEKIFDRPSESDFAWFDNIIADSNDLPDDVEMIKDAPEINGDWKGRFLYYDSEQDPIANELINAEISAGDRAATVTIYWYVINYGEGYIDETKNEKMVMDGVLDDGEIRTFGTNASLDINIFYTSGSKQYALGFMTLPSGEGAYLGLVRDIPENSITTESETT